MAGFKEDTCRFAGDKNACITCTTAIIFSRLNRFTRCILSVYFGHGNHFQMPPYFPPHTQEHNYFKELLRGKYELTYPFIMRPLCLLDRALSQILNLSLPSEC